MVDCEIRVMRIFSLLLTSGQIGILDNNVYIKGTDVVTFYTDKNIIAQTTDPGAGSALETGRIVLVYE